jgi:hypothetical protein
MTREYRIDFNGHRRSGGFPVLGVLIFFLVFYFKADAFIIDSSDKLNRGIFLLIFFLPVLIILPLSIHLEYWYLNKNIAFFINSKNEEIIIRDKSEMQISFNEVREVIMYCTYPRYRGVIGFLSIDDYYYYKLITKDRIFIITSLMIEEGILEHLFANVFKKFIKYPPAVWIDY